MLCEYGVQQTNFFIILGHFLSLYPTNNLKNQNSEKMKKKNTWRYHHFTLVTNNHVVCGSWDRAQQTNLLFWTIFCPFSPPDNLENQNFEKIKKAPEDIIILHKCTINDIYMMYGSWDMKCDKHKPCFTALNNPKNQNFEKMKKMRGDIFILHKCIKNHDHMLAWDKVHDRCKCYFSFWTIFCPFTLLTTQKFKILKK